MDFTFRAKVWLYQGKGAWHFVTLPKAVSLEVRGASKGLAKAWGSVRVTAVIGATRWETSLFPDTKRGAYLLPIKAAVRAKEQLRDGDMVEVSISAARDAV